VIVERGATIVAASKLRAGVSAEAGVEAKASCFGLLSAKLGISAEASAEASKEYELKIDTTKSSYLYYFVSMYDYVAKVQRNIKIEKEFQCVSGPRHDFGDKITAIFVEIDSDDNPDPVSYKFDNPEAYLTMPEEIFDFSRRPLFISLNSPDVHTRAVSKLMGNTGINDRRLAEFIIASINYACPQSSRKTAQSWQSRSLATKSSVSNLC
jgi:hypothetical protein